MSVVGTLRAASVFDTSLSTLILCVRNKTSVWWLLSHAKSAEFGCFRSPLTAHLSPLIVNRFPLLLIFINISVNVWFLTQKECFKSLKKFNFALVNQGIPEKLMTFRHDNPLVRARSALSPHFMSREYNCLYVKKIPPPPPFGIRALRSVVWSGRHVLCSIGISVVPLCPCSVCPYWFCGLLENY